MTDGTPNEVRCQHRPGGVTLTCGPEAFTRVQAYRWLSGLTPAAWERFRQDLRDGGVTDVVLPG